MFQRYFLYMVGILYLFHLKAQINENSVGFNHEVVSQHLGKTLQVQVYVPESYNTSSQNYPTLYLLEKYPESVSLLNKAGSSLQALGRTDKAKVYLDKAASLSEN